MPDRHRESFVTHLDPRHPLVVDTRALGRSPGAMRRESRTVAAPHRLGLDLIGVPEGAETEVDLRLEAVMEGVLVTATARAPLTGECARCLEPIQADPRRATAVVEFQELYAYPGREADEDAYTMDGDLLDLEPALRDALVTSLPPNPLCRDDCPGLCPECGVRLADVPDHRHDVTDPRWAALEGFRPGHRNVGHGAGHSTGHHEKNKEN